MRDPFEEEEFIYDFKVFLSYITSHKVRLTPKMQWIPVKHIYAINSLFKHPASLQEKIGEKVYKLREEIGYSRFYFIDLLSLASECLVVNDKQILTKGPQYDNFMQADAFFKKLGLVISWWFDLYWDSWMPEGDFGQMLDSRKLYMIPYLEKVLHKQGMISVKEFSRPLIEGLSLKWSASSPDIARDLMEWGIERCILLPLSYFDIVRLEYRENKYGLQEIGGFYIKPDGRIFLRSLVREMRRRIYRDFSN